MRVLIVKTSSMGDVIHTLPALTDAKRAIPDIVFDWVVEEGFQELPVLHPAVNCVFPIAIRRWRKNIIKTWLSREVKHFRKLLRKHHYDLVIDAQGLVKSAWAARLARIPIAGYDRDSIREPLASFAYQKKYQVDKNLHAVERIRELFSQALHYPKPSSKGDYGVDRKRFATAAVSCPYVVFLHSTTRVDKHYPEVYWRQLAIKINDMGLSVHLPWGTEKDKQRAQRIAQGMRDVEVLPHFNLKGVASVLAQATAVVAVDTGLGHFCAALNVPAISLYGPTLPSLIGAYGENQTHLYAKDCRSIDNNKVEPAVFAALTPEIIFESLESILKNELEK